MSGKFTHYLVTRFNVPLESWLKDKSRGHRADAKWFSHRIDLFSTIFVPSVAAQVNKNFQWILYCDTATDQEQVFQLKRILQPLSNASLRFATDKDSLLEDLRNVLREAPTPFVATSRLDNDDAIGPGYISILQKSFSEENNLLFNFRTGLYYDLNRHILTRMQSEIPNAYTTLLEKKDPGELLTIYAFHHTDLPTHVKLHPLDEEDQWLKIIHDRNVKSTLKGKPIFKWPANFASILPNKQLPISVGSSILYAINRIGQQ